MNKKSVKKNYYRADMNVQPTKIDISTEKEIAERYSQGYSIKSIVSFVMAKELMKEADAQSICEKTILKNLRGD